MEKINILSVHTFSVIYAMVTFFSFKISKYQLLHSHNLPKP